MVCVEQTCSTHDPTTQRFDDSTTYISHKHTVHRAATTARAPPPRPVAPVVPFMRHEHLEINVPRFNLNKLIKIRITTRCSAGNQRIARVEGTARAGPGGGENRENVRQCGSNAGRPRAGGDPPCACPCASRVVRFARLPTPYSGFPAGGSPIRADARVCPPRTRRGRAVLLHASPVGAVRSISPLSRKTAAQRDGTLHAPPKLLTPMYNG